MHGSFKKKLKIKRNTVIKAIFKITFKIGPFILNSFSILQLRRTLRNKSFLSRLEL